MALCNPADVFTISKPSLISLMLVRERTTSGIFVDEYISLAALTLPVICAPARRCSVKNRSRSADVEIPIEEPANDVAPFAPTFKVAITLIYEGYGQFTRFIERKAGL
jgi:hypothetical protein